MRKLMEVAGGCLMIAGGAGLLNEWLGWFPRFFGFLRFLNVVDMNEIAFHAIVLAVGLVLAVVADQAKPASGG
jgi:hypothetical protein